MSKKVLKKRIEAKLNRHLSIYEESCTSAFMQQKADEQLEKAAICVTVLNYLYLIERMS